MVVLLKILQVVLALSVLIAVHELGHFTFAKLFHTRVDKFYLFFDFGGKYLFSTKRSKWFSRLFPSSKAWETDYGIGWLPLGGYCKINGMVDESMDTEMLNNEPQPWEMRSKPAWQRLLVMFGGVLFNFIFAIIVFIGILYVNGDTYIENKGNAIYTNELARDMGFRDGDVILSLDDYIPQDFSMLQADIARRSVNKVTVLRGADTVRLYIDPHRISEILNSPDMFTLAVPFVIDSVPPVSVNAGSGLRRGDKVVSINGMPVSFVQDSWEILAKHKGETVETGIVRQPDTLMLAMQVDTLGKFGVFPKIPGIVKRDYNLLQAVPAGVVETFRNISGYVSDLKLVATPKTGAYKSVGSFIALGQVFPSQWNWMQFIYLLAMLSIMLGVMNLLPIPGLDGGHIVFILYEMLTGRKPSTNFLVAAQLVGMALLMLLMFVAFGNDIGRLIH